MSTKVPVRKKRNKSAAIRKYFHEHPQAGPTEVVKALAAGKIRVTPTLVSNVKARMESNGAGPKRRGRPAKADNISLSLLKEAKRFAGQVGSIEAAKRALDTLSQLQ